MKDIRRQDPKTVYADIIGLPHWDSPVHPRMSLAERAAQFAPYAALVGYGDLVKEEARETISFAEPGEDDAEELSRVLAALERLISEGKHPVCTIRYFVPDAVKSGGEYMTVVEAVRQIDPVRRRLILEKRNEVSGSREEIDLDRVVRITGEEPEIC